MREYARCGVFTDVPVDGDSQYCFDCQQEFNEVAESGVVVDRTSDGYHVYTRTEEGESKGGVEDSQVTALARGKYVADDIGVRSLFRYDKTASQWLLDEYLRTHPSIRRDVVERLTTFQRRRILDSSTESGVRFEAHNFTKTVDEIHHSP